MCRAQCRHGRLLQQHELGRLALPRHTAMNMPPLPLSTRDLKRLMALEKSSAAPLVSMTMALHLLMSRHRLHSWHTLQE